MGKKTVTKFEFSFLIIAALCFEVLLIDRTFHIPPLKTTWTEARIFCQKYYTDLITMKVMSMSTLTETLRVDNIYSVWVGLHRDPRNDSVWKWINVKTGEGLEEPDVSSSSIWAPEEPSSHCALVGNDQLWRSQLCSNKNKVHCTDRIGSFTSTARKRWQEGLRYCLSQNGNISVVSTANSNYFTSTGWIGLRRQAESKWVWPGNSSSLYTNWAAGEPITKDCGLLKSSNGRFHSYECSTELNFVCYDDNVVVVNKNKTWEQALRHCTNLAPPCFDSNCTSRYEMVNLRRLQDYGYVRDLLHKATTDEVWIGLRFLGVHWLWMNGQNPDDQGKLPSCPPQAAHCGTLSKNDTNNWTIRDCTEKINFVCYKHRF